MKASKRKKLEAAGWRVGSAEEFLGLSSAASLKDKPHHIPDICLEHLVRVFCGEGADLEPEDFKHVAILVRHEVARRARARGNGAAGARINRGR